MLGVAVAFAVLVLKRKWYGFWFGLVFCGYGILTAAVAGDRLAVIQAGIFCLLCAVAMFQWRFDAMHRVLSRRDAMIRELVKENKKMRFFLSRLVRLDKIVKERYGETAGTWIGAEAKRLLDDV